MILCAPFPSPAINAVAPGAFTTQAQAQPYQASPAPRYSPGVADVLKMVEARIDPEVLKAYVQASPVAYNLTASEIIALKNIGVPSEVLTAMIQRGGEVRSQLQRSGQSPAAPAPQTAYPGAAPAYAPAYDYSAQTVYPARSESVV